MSDLSDERVRATAVELARCADSWMPAARLVGNLRAEELAALGTGYQRLEAEMLALRERVAAWERGLEGRVVLTDEDYAALIRQRDEAVAVAREAVEGMAYVDTVVRSAIGNTLRARLAAITGEG